MPAPRPPAVLFDLDGTLIDSIALILNSARSAFEAFNLDWPGDRAWTAEIGTPLLTQLAKYSTTRITADHLIAAYREYQFANHDRLVRAYEDIPRVVAELHRRKHPMAVVTSKRDGIACHGLQHVGLSEFFRTVVGCDSSTKHKPDPEPVMLALDRLGYAPHEAVFVGDSTFDIEAGNSAGTTTIGVLWGPFSRAQLEASQPDLIAEQPLHLLRLIPGLTSSLLMVD